MNTMEEVDERIVELILASQAEPLSGEETDEFAELVGYHLVAIFTQAGLSFDEAVEKAEDLLIGGCVDASLSGGELKITVTRGEDTDGQ